MHIVVKKDIAVIIAIVKIQLNASNTIAITHWFLATVRHGIKVKYEKSITVAEARKIVENQFHRV